MRILGFSQQHLISQREVLGALSVLPAWHIHGIEIIRYDPSRHIASAINQYLEPLPTTVRGSFYQSDTMNAIIIWRFDSVREFYHIFFHEVAHFVFMNSLAQSQRDQWLYDVRPNEKVTVSEYACTNAKEDFSECYASWFTQQHILERCPVRHRFFLESVFVAERPVEN